MTQYTIRYPFDRIYPLTQKYGENVEYYKAVSNGALQHGHEGNDFGTPVGTPLYSPLTGIIARDGINDKDYGNFVVVRDPLQKCAVWACHMQQVLVTEGQSVEAGQLIGYTGNTGNVMPKPTAEEPNNGAHCHVNFCLTDENGMRINTDNGSLGFLDIEDPALVRITNIPGEVTPQPAAVVNTDPAYVTQLETDRETFWKERDKALTDLQEMTLKYNDVNGKYTGFVAMGYNTADDVKAVLTQKDETITGTAKELSQALDRNTTLANELAKKDQEDSTAIDTGLDALDANKTLRSNIEEIVKASGSPKADIPTLLTHINNIRVIAEDEVNKIENEAARNGYPIRNSINSFAGKIKRLVAVGITSASGAGIVYFIHQNFGQLIQYFILK